MAHTVGAILIRDGHVLLGRRAAHKSFARRWDMIGGHIEPGETSASALDRELWEELGVRLLGGELIANLPVADGDHPSILHVYLVDSWIGEVLIRNDEHTEIKWFTPQDAACLPDLAIAEYRDLFVALSRCRSKSVDAWKAN